MASCGGIYSTQILDSWLVAVAVVVFVSCGRDTFGDDELA